jgi:hypothetical protein
MDVRYCPRGGPEAELRGRPIGGPQPTGEAVEVRAFVPSDTAWEHLGFWSDERVLRNFFGRPRDRTAAAGGWPPAR